MIANKYIFYFLFFLFIFLSETLYTQNIEFKRTNFKTDKKGLKDAKNSIQVGDEFRDKAIINLINSKDAIYEAQNAIFHYYKAQSFNSNNADLNYKIGSMLLLTNDKELAKDYFEKALLFDIKLDDYFYFFYGIALQLDAKYDKALESYQYFLENSKKKITNDFNLLVKKYIQECNYAPSLLENEQKVWIDNLTINSEFDDWSPCLSTDGELLIFTSNRKNKNEVNDIGLYDQDIYFSNLSNNNFNNVSSLSELNTINDDVAVGISYDGQRLLLYKEEDGNTDIYESKLSGDSWGNIYRKMGDKLKGGNSDKNETFASFDPPDVKLYYITDGGYTGNADIYFSGVMNKDRNIWGKGQSAGIINSKFQEGSVYIHPDGRTMYFSSKGHNSIGGYDIFVSHVDELGHWGEPKNLGFPINTPYDDLFYSPTASGRYAYIASNRPGGKGGLDIYKVTYYGDEKPMTVDFEDQLISSIARTFSDNKVVKPINNEEKSLTIFKGKIIDKITANPIRAEINIIINSTGETFTTVYSNSLSGKFLLSLPSGENYGISVTADKYLFHSENFDLPKSDGFNIVEKDIELKNIQIGNNITLRNVFFNIGKWDLRSDSYSELDKLVDLLLSIKSINIEISGHTDNIGSESFNKLLSQKRADAVKSYLIEHGVDVSRISSIGYGQTKPVSLNNTEEGRAKNRRTEFKIIKN
tara:strand:- start:2064 stop:4157 length:2094 start_codon:yes stop_codon:yes gene_type:complete